MGKIQGRSAQAGAAGASGRKFLPWVIGGAAVLFVASLLGLLCGTSGSAQTPAPVKDAM
jgi:hypothetical protein